MKNRNEANMNEFHADMRKKEQFLKEALDILGEHYNGVVVLVHCFDPVTQASASRFATQGDPLATRQLALKFLREQEMLEQHQFHMHLNSLQRPPNEDQSGERQPPN